MMNTSMEWFEITTKVIIPLLGIISTTTIGIVIAIMLKRREERGRIKNLLIDNYLSFASSMKSYYAYAPLICAYRIFKDITLNYASYLDPGRANGVQMDLLNRKKDELNAKREEMESDVFNWGLYTMKFGFLLGVRNLEKKLDQAGGSRLDADFDEASRTDFINHVKPLIRNNVQILDHMNSGDLIRIQQGIEFISDLVTKEYYNKFKFENLYRFNKVISEMIEKY
jgi:hypothetical protein